ncbi:lytic transglycosylase domain-containing protein (plasmid) [Xanthomonas campestris pv. campestris]|uniref:lytic transglycosylase domain-containing protein n=1 Tax=Xanthomonas TaxID=338 RepID=UPI0015E2A124|nr:lytic transglycosylase domain-containing protein [Xanthomonas arboricola]WDJ74907.1 lytic transglycosylase domain-containing protein [Xanthomonas campestris pv. campestris]
MNQDFFPMQFVRGDLVKLAWYAIGVTMMVVSHSAQCVERGRLPTAEREACIASAAAMYAVPAQLIKAYIRTEGGTTGQVSRPNANGSVDMGYMQINTVHLPKLARLGITRERVINDECLNIHIGTYLIHYEVYRPDKRAEPLWVNLASYNSRTPCARFDQAGKPCPNREYQQKLWSNLQKVTQGN